MRELDGLLALLPDGCVLAADVAAFYDPDDPDGEEQVGDGSWSIAALARVATAHPARLRLSAAWLEARHGERAPLRALCRSAPFSTVGHLVLSFAAKFMRDEDGIDDEIDDAGAKRTARDAFAPLPALRHLHTLEVRNAGVIAAHALVRVLPALSPLRRLNFGFDDTAVGHGDSDSCDAVAALMRLAMAAPPLLEVFCADLGGRMCVCAPRLVAILFNRCPSLSSIQLRSTDDASDAVCDRVSREMESAVLARPDVRVSFHFYSIWRGMTAYVSRLHPCRWRLQSAEDEAHPDGDEWRGSKYSFLCGHDGDSLLMLK